MLGFGSEQRLRDLLVAVGDGERDLEASRQRLCSIRDFGLHSCFERIDRDCSNAIGSIELVAFLRDNATFHVSEPEAFNLIKFFDSDGSNRLSFQEFIQMVLPCEDNVLRNITIDRPSIRIGRFDRLPIDIEAAVTTIVVKEVELARRLEMLKHDLEVAFDYTSMAAFRSVDKYNSGLITTVNLGAFLRSNGHFASETELLAIVRRLDTDGDASVNYSEWCEFLRATPALPAPLPPPIHRPPPVYDPLPYYRYPGHYNWPYYSRFYNPYGRYEPYPYSAWEYNNSPVDVPLPGEHVADTRYHTEKLGPSAYSPSRTVKRTTYSSPMGRRTTTRFL